MILLSTSNTKIVKGEKVGYYTAILHLAPHMLSGYNTCPMASRGCSSACLNTAGRGHMSAVQEARIKKTKFFFENRMDFMKVLDKDIISHVKSAERKGLVPIIRLNGTSDIPWERIAGPDGKTIIERHKDLQFYDYTKRPGRVVPPNYNLTFSLSEDNEKSALAELKRGFNVAVVFRTPPDKFWGHPVIDGDETDLRFLDPARVIVGLKAKGKAKKDTSGFVR